MNHRIIMCDSLIKKITKKDLLFDGNYCLDPYQNCEYECKYCDSSLEKTVYIKINADKILEEEIEQLEKGVIIIGSVNDPYQESEKKYEITKKLLKVLKRFDFPCHILTKSNLVLRDVELLKEMNCAVTISIISLNKNITSLFEKNLPNSNNRVETLKSLIKNNIKAGVALIPIIPYIIDDELEEIIQKAHVINAQYFLHKYLQLMGDQKAEFIKTIQLKFPHLVATFEELYRCSYRLNENIESNYNKTISALCKKYNLSEKINIS